jgi:tripartite-type tricarboxylate transporter receptor subunit TctC
MKRKIVVNADVMLLACLLALLTGCDAQKKLGKYPTKPITIIVPWSAGGSTDMIARVPAAKLAEKWGVAVNVTAKPGSKGIPGTVEALGGAPDGYTLLADADGSNAIPAAWDNEVPFDVAERTFIARIAQFPWVFAIRADLPWKSLDDVAAALKANPGGVKWGWLGGTAGADGPVAQFKAACKSRGIDVSRIKMVTYPGGADLVTALASGHVDIGSASTTSVGPMFSAGQIKLIGVTGAERYVRFPAVPSTVEQGWDTVTFQGHVGYAGPKDMPADIVKAIEEGVKEILSTPEAKAELVEIGATPAFAGSSDFRKYVLDLVEELKRLK